MTKIRHKNKRLQSKKFEKWCKRVCQRIRSSHSFSTTASLQLHSIKNPQRNEAGICIDYTTENVFSVTSQGQIKKIGRIVVEGKNEGIIHSILQDDYDLL